MCDIFLIISFAQNYFPFEERNKKSLLRAYYDDYRIYRRLSLHLKPWNPKNDRSLKLIIQRFINCIYATRDLRSKFTWKHRKFALFSFILSWWNFTVGAVRVSPSKRAGKRLRKSLLCNQVEKSSSRELIGKTVCVDKNSRTGAVPIAGEDCS